MNRTLASLIRRHTVVSTRHLTPEVPLRLITPECELFQARTPHPFKNDPFWAFYWPGGQALTRYILDGASGVQGKRVLDVGSGCGACSIAAVRRGATFTLYLSARYILDGASGVQGKRVLDVGSGCGACSIAAVRRGATFTLANDIDECAISAIQLNAELNKVTLDSSKDDLIGTACEEFDTILIGDMFYDEEFANRLFTWLEQLAKLEKTILIGDPGRHGLTDSRRKMLELRAKYQLKGDGTIENNGFHEAFVWKLNLKK